MTRRLRFLRILLPALLLLVVAWFLHDCRLPPSVHSVPEAQDGADTQRVDDVNVIGLVGAATDLKFHAAELEERDGRYWLSGIEGLEIPREGRGPLVISASEGEGSGQPGARVWTFEREVVVRDPEAGLELHLPRVEVDQQAGIARATGEIRLEGPDLRGTARELLYGLEGQPREIVEPDFTDDTGGHVRAARGVLVDGTRTIDLTGDVRAARDGQRLGAASVRLVRDELGALRRVSASGDVAGDWPMASGPATLAAGRLEAAWSPSGELTELRLHDGSRLRQGERQVTAASIVATRREAGWHVDAQGGVEATGLVSAGAARLTGERVAADLDAMLALREAEATGRVIFDGRGMRAEADRATFRGGLPLGELRLYGAGLRKPRLASGQTRVAADEILTDPRGEHLEAVGRVEASLLPAAGTREGSAGVFEAGTPVHFVAERLDGSSSGERLHFRGAVRGWQGERNLAAEDVTFDRATSRMEARGAVATRLPRQVDLAATEADYVEIAAAAMSYDDAARRAVYTGKVRARLAEGWLECGRLEVDLDPATRRIQRVRAMEEVRAEFHPPPDAREKRAISALADRLEYDPAAATVRLFGESAPASVRRLGEGGGTTSGRLLRYRLDLGTLEVEAGEQGPARIRTAAS